MKKILVISVNNFFLKKFKKKNYFFITKKKQLNFNKIKKINPNIIFFPHWSWKIPSLIINNFHCIGFHSTPLPYGRGGTPIQNMIIRGYKKTELCSFKLNDTLDGGAIYLRNKFSLMGNYDQIANRMYKLISFQMKKIIKHMPKEKVQKGKIVVFKRRKPKDSKLDFVENIKKIYNKVRMLDSKEYKLPKAFYNIGNYTLTFSNADLNTKDFMNCNVKITSKK